MEVERNIFNLGSNNHGGRGKNESHLAEGNERNRCGILIISIPTSVGSVHFNLTLGLVFDAPYHTHSSGRCSRCPVIIVGTAVDGVGWRYDIDSKCVVRSS